MQKTENLEAASKFFAAGEKRRDGFLDKIKPLVL